MSPLARPSDTGTASRTEPDFERIDVEAVIHPDGHFILIPVAVLMRGSCATEDAGKGCGSSGVSSGLSEQALEEADRSAANTMLRACVLGWRANQAGCQRARPSEASKCP